MKKFPTLYHCYIQWGCLKIFRKPNWNYMSPICFRISYDHNYNVLLYEVKCRWLTDPHMVSNILVKIASENGLISRDHSVYAPNQWEMTLHCNVISHWLGAYRKWSLDVCLQCYAFTRNNNDLLRIGPLIIKLIKTQFFNKIYFKVVFVKHQKICWSFSLWYKKNSEHYSSLVSKQSQ